MAEKIQLSGLCINCLNADDCGYRANHTKPIIFCEEFSCDEPKDSYPNDIGKISETDDYPINPIPNGLCSNCENSETCNLQKTDSNVINCEEYK